MIEVDIREPTLNHLFFYAAENFDHSPLLSYAQDDRSITYSTRQFRDAVLSLRRFLLASGLREGDRVAILSENRPEWHVADFAVLTAGLISVPIYTTLSPAQMQHILRHSSVAALVVSHEKLWERVAPFRAALPDLRRVISFDEWPGRPEEAVPLARALAECQENDETRAQARRAALAVDPSTVATIAYTSGTTGPPKGAMLTHANLLFNVREGVRRMGFKNVAQGLSVLPLSHAFERLLCYGYFRVGIPIAYGDPYRLAEHFRRFRPEVMACVPRMLEKIQETVQGQIQALPQWKQRVSGRLIRAAVDCRGAWGPACHPAVSSRLLCLLADPLVFRKVRQGLGGRLRYFISGGARLDVRVEEFFRAAGIHVVQGYGLTETSPVITVNPYGREKPGTVGQPLEGVEVKFDSDGELLTRGPHVMRGYYRDPEATARAFQDGWFRTGDLGRLDSDGYLVLTGRKKELLVTSGGKNISPGPIEEELRRSPLIQQAVLVGDGRKFVSALIIPEREALLSYARGADIPFAGEDDLLRSTAVLNRYRDEIERFQQGFSEFEKVKKFCLLEESVLHDPEIMTPTQKLRRQVLEEKFRSRIDQMYRSE